MHVQVAELLDEEQAKLQAAIDRDAITHAALARAHEGASRRGAENNRAQRRKVRHVLTCSCGVQAGATDFDLLSNGANRQTSRTRLALLLLKRPL